MDFVRRDSEMLRVLACLALLLSTLACSRAGTTTLGATSTPPAGSLSPSGKFSLGSPAAPLKDPTEAVTALKQALKVEQVGTNKFRIGLVEFDKERRTVTLPARICLRTQVVEYALVCERGKTYESLLKTEAAPRDIHLACLLLGLGQTAVSGDLGKPASVWPTNSVGIAVAWETNGQSVTYALADLVRLGQDSAADQGAPMRLERWLYNGSVFDRSGFAAQSEGSVVALIRDPSALVNNPGPDRDNDRIHFPNAAILPPQEWPVRVVFLLGRK